MEIINTFLTSPPPHTRFVRLWWHARGILRVKEPECVPFPVTFCGKSKVLLIYFIFAEKGSNLAGPDAPYLLGKEVHKTQGGGVEFPPCRHSSRTAPLGHCAAGTERRREARDIIRTTERTLHGRAAEWLTVMGNVGAAVLCWLAGHLVRLANR